ncbi:uncharacterized protein METZ01_LOCUS491834, partial [marine metagenome]
ELSMMEGDIIKISADGIGMLSNPVQQL